MYFHFGLSFNPPVRDFKELIDPVQAPTNNCGASLFPPSTMAIASYIDHLLNRQGVGNW